MRANAVEYRVSKPRRVRVASMKVSAVRLWRATVDRRVFGVAMPASVVYSRSSRSSDCWLPEYRAAEGRESASTCSCTALSNRLNAIDSSAE